MKTLSYLTLALMFTLSAPISELQAQSGGAGTGSQEEIPPIVAHMRQVGQNLRQLRRQLTPDKKEENLKLVREMRLHVEKAAKEQPLKTPEIPAAERDEFLKGYRALLSKVVDTMSELEISLQEGDLDKAQTYVAALNEIRKEGHSKYQQEEE